MHAAFWRVCRMKARIGLIAREEGPQEHPAAPWRWIAACGAWCWRRMWPRFYPCTSTKGGRGSYLGGRATHRFRSACAAKSVCYPPTPQTPGARWARAKAFTRLLPATESP